MLIKESVRRFLIRASVASIISLALGFLLTFAAMGIAGGTAIGGKVEVGKYYVYLKGRHIETSAAGWIFSLFAVGMTLVSGILAFVGALILQVMVGLPALRKLALRIGDAFRGGGLSG